MDLWERGLHAGLVGDSEAEGDAREGRSTSGGEDEDEDEDEALAQSYHDTVLSSKPQQATCRATDREGRGCLLPDDQFTKTGLLVAEVLR